MNDFLRFHTRVAQIGHSEEASWYNRPMKIHWQGRTPPGFPGHFVLSVKGDWVAALWWSNPIGVSKIYWNLQTPTALLAKDSDCRCAICLRFFLPGRRFWRKLRNLMETESHWADPTAAWDSPCSMAVAARLATSSGRTDLLPKLCGSITKKKGDISEMFLLIFVVIIKQANLTLLKFCSKT